MRTKTPKQIHEQTMRILKKMAKNGWDGKRYTPNPQRTQKAHRICEIESRYLDKIYLHNGIQDRFRGDTAKCNYLWETAATPVSIYAKK